MTVWSISKIWKYKAFKWLVLACVAIVVVTVIWTNLQTRELTTKMTVEVEGDHLELLVRDPQLLRIRARVLHGVLRNAERFGPASPDTPVLAVRLRRGAGPAALRRLLRQLGNVKHIETTVLVFSHTVYDVTLNDLVAGVHFCRVMQLFYPYSIQLNPVSFPGPDPHDCGFQNSTSDAECSPRDARLVEDKNHWWWTAHYVFERVAGRAPAMFLEQHDAVSPDVLHMMQTAQRALSYFPNAQLLALGRQPARALHPSLLTLEAWRPAHSVGITFNRTTWRKIVELAVHFCMYNDRSWSYSLFNVFRQFPTGHADVVVCAAARVVDSRLAMDGWQASKLFPERVWVWYRWERGQRQSGGAAALSGPAGGWADLRDQLLCLDPELDMSADAEDDEGEQSYETVI